MTVNDLITALLTYPVEVREQQIYIQDAKSGIDIIHSIYSLSQNQYHSCDCGLIPQEEYETFPNGEPNDEYGVKKDFELAYPEGTVFLSAIKTPNQVEPAEETLADRMHDVVAKFDDNATDFMQGGIPHLRIERE